jgi:hypothetical protein
MLRKFKIGQFVEYQPSREKTDRVSQIYRIYRIYRSYRITGLLPPREDAGEPEYLIRNSSEGYERIAGESQLRRLQRPKAGQTTTTK